ncbi:hypothetical protein QLL95_gp0551 [Cotonvirus japonicus]|uniref:Uncharacterized protein n=1 Tax=Cotonvirus japonicus TaxID=2811091 RepID=A0ABM7NTS1_9VIRU|nr:hypothetical protein QLL95_gp0551 [Cotonvirus japonicus]BCS83572.1 hypothetical protein [Cotonvirus japonicus]
MNYIFHAKNLSDAKNKFKKFLNKNETMLNELINKFVSDNIDPYNKFKNENHPEIDHYKVKMFDLIFNDVHEKVNLISKIEDEFVGHSRLEYDTGVGITDYQHFDRRKPPFNEKNKIEKKIEKLCNLLEKKINKKLGTYVKPDPIAKYWFSKHSKRSEN